MQNFNYTYPEELRDELLGFGFSQDNILEAEEDRNAEAESLYLLPTEKLTEIIEATEDKLEEVSKNLDVAESINRLLENKDFSAFQEAYFEDEKNRIAGAITDGTPLELKFKEELHNALGAIGYTKLFIKTIVSDLQQLRVDSINYMVDLDYYSLIIKSQSESKK